MRGNIGRLDELVAGEERIGYQPSWSIHCPDFADGGAASIPRPCGLAPTDGPVADLLGGTDLCGTRRALSVMGKPILVRWPRGVSTSPAQTLSLTRQRPMPQLAQALKSLVLTGAEGQPQPSGDRVPHLSSGSRKPSALEQVYQAIYEVTEPL